MEIVKCAKTPADTFFIESGMKLNLEPEELGLLHYTLAWLTVLGSLVVQTVPG